MGVWAKGQSNQEGVSNVVDKRSDTDCPLALGPVSSYQVHKLKSRNIYPST
jgi:hypothetical protein